ncbi:MAG: acyl-CoA dehydrogenase FadE [Gammaproteobacteria bacterium]|nr:MAG: acyl-CoA dehydrogenase FadE [Gammaproteobacteria bacterium]
MTALFLAILVLSLLLLAYYRIPLLISIAILAGLTFAFTELRHFYPIPGWFRWSYGIITVSLAGFAIKPLRRLLISNRLFSVYRKVMPRLSTTEREALEAGTVWWERELFSGKPRWRRLLRQPAPSLSDAEQEFINGPVEELCLMLDDWEISDKLQDLPAPVWQFIRDKRFFSMIIPKEYGGLEFSAQANSAVVMKLASANLTAAVTVMVPNSLGPGELLLHYGTDAQRKYYLPRLASGEDIPCFALTSPLAGSDAGAMPDRGIVCMGEFKGEEVLGLKVSWDKRYITLAPVATLLGLAFHAYDPDALLGDEKDLGITCALVPADTPGVEIGNRHMPVGAVFMNGPTRGKDIFIPMDWLIGGQERIGQGWRMLMQSLAAGRAISLPSLGVAGGKMASMLTGAYARIRTQFDVPIGYFGGVEEPLSRIGGRTYRMDSACRLTLIALDQGEKPGVLAAINKYEQTESCRQCIIDAMDVHGGKGIIQGPNNYLARAYQALPISITVEGANILTRSLIIFGQGVIRAHPSLLKEMTAVTGIANSKARRVFDNALFEHIGYTISNLVRSLLLGLTGSRMTSAPVRGPHAAWYRLLTRFSAVFAFISDSVLVLLGGKFKFKEKLSGRLADTLIHLYLASAMLKRFEDDGRPQSDLPLLTWGMEDSLYKIQQSLLGVLRNFPVPVLGRLIHWLVFPLGLPCKGPTDKTVKAVARLLLDENEARDRLTDGVYISDKDDATGRVHKAFHLVLEAAPAERAIKNALQETVNFENYEGLVKRATESGVITEEQATMVRLAQRASARVIAVDDFPFQRPEAFRNL